MVRRSAPLLVTLAALIGFAVVVGYELQSSGKENANPLGIGQPLRALAVTLTQPAVSLPLTVALLALSAWLFRRVRLAWLVWWGGPVLVSDFKAGSKLSTVKAPQLSALFRERLAVLRLQSATPSPGPSPEGTFVDVLTSGDSSSGTVLGLLLRVLRAAIPTYAIELQGVVRERDDGYELTVQVLQSPSQPSPVVQVREGSWERAVRLAADEATAAILPRSRMCRGPWAAWRGYRMPAALLSAYEDASEHEQERRFDQALDRYWEALRHDPINPMIRLQLGQLQEKAGLSLAALTSYLRILAFANPGGGNIPWGLYARTARRELDRAIILAKYRAIVLLGEASIVAQWSKTDAGEQISYRERLRREFCEVLRPLASTCRRDPAADAISKTTSTLLGARPDICGSEEQQIREELMDGARIAAEELRLSLPRPKLTPSRLPLTRRTVALTQLCIERRGALMRNEHLDCRALRQLDRQVRLAGRAPRRWAGWWPPGLRRWQWHEHYNAACAYSIPLNRHYPHADPKRQCEKVSEELSRHAIQRLERAVTIRESNFLVTWRDWVVSEDPDLNGLRDRPAFRAFQTMYFPSKGPIHPGPDGSPRPHHLLAQSRYTRHLLAAIAQRQHDAWHQQATTQSDLHTLLAWCKDDRELWHLVNKVAADPYDWRIRQELLTGMTKLHTRKSTVQVSFARHEDLPAARQRDQDAAAQEDRDLANTRMRTVAKLLRGPNGASADASAKHFAIWIATTRRFPAHPSKTMSHSERAGLCNQHAAVWHAFSDWLCAEDEIWAGPLEQADPRKSAHDRMHDRIKVAEDRFVEELRKTAKLWRQAEGNVWRCKLRTRS